MSLDKGRRGEGVITPHVAMEHYLLARGLRRFTCRWKKIHDKHFKAFMHRVDLKSFIHVNCCKSSQIKISNYRIKSNLVMLQTCPKYSLLSPLQIRRTSASSLEPNNFPREMKAERAFRRSLILCFSFGKSHSTIAPSCPPIHCLQLQLFQWGADTEPGAGGAQPQPKPCTTSKNI